MNKEEIQAEIKRLQELLEKADYELPRVEQNNIYYFIDVNNHGFYVENTRELYTCFDSASYKQYNYFTDENKAKQYADHIKLTLELFQIRDLINGDWKPDWSNKNAPKHYMFLDNKSIITDYIYTTVRPFAFQTAEKREKFIELVGEEKIRQYYQF